MKKNLVNVVLLFGLLGILGLMMTDLRFSSNLLSKAFGLLIFGVAYAFVLVRIFGEYQCTWPLFWLASAVLCGVVTLILICIYPDQLPMRNIWQTGFCYSGIICFTWLCKLHRSSSNL